MKGRPVHSIRVVACVGAALAAGATWAQSPSPSAAESASPPPAEPLSAADERLGWPGGFSAGFEFGTVGTGDAVTAAGFRASLPVAGPFAVRARAFALATLGFNQGTRPWWMGVEQLEGLWRHPVTDRIQISVGIGPQVYEVISEAFANLQPTGTLQVSVGGELGVEFLVTRHLGASFEVGLGAGGPSSIGTGASVLAAVEFHP